MTIVRDNEACPERFPTSRIRKRLYDLEEPEHSEMENDEGQYRNEDGFVFAFFKDFLKH
jgi:hypothetical protein